jgi:DNA polymerase III subunit alpha
VPITALNKRSIESLIKGGGFDQLGHSRRGLMEVFEQIIDLIVPKRRKEEVGVFELFDFGAAASPSAPTSFDDARLPIATHEWEKMTRLAFEKEMLGLYISDHPLLGAHTALRKATDCSILDIKEGGVKVGPSEGGGGRDGGVSTKTVGGVITGLQRKYTKKGDLMAVFTLEDLESSIEVMVFPKTMIDCGWMLADDAIVAIRARIDDRDDVPKLIAMDIKRLEIKMDGEGPPIRLQVAESGLRPQRVEELREVLRSHPGDSEVYVHFGKHIVRLPSEFNVEPTTRLMTELRVLLGENALLV